MTESVMVNAKGDSAIQRVRWLLNALDDEDDVAAAELHIEFDPGAAHDTDDGDNNVRRPPQVQAGTQEAAALRLFGEYISAHDEETATANEIAEYARETGQTELSSDQIRNALSQLRRRKGLLEREKTDDPRPMNIYELSEEGQEELAQMNDEIAG